VSVSTSRESIACLGVGGAGGNGAGPSTAALAAAVSSVLIGEAILALQDKSKSVHKIAKNRMTVPLSIEAESRDESRLSFPTLLFQRFYFFT
jgi:hypothetical protein